MKAENSDLINVSNEALGFSKPGMEDDTRKHRRNTDRIRGNLLAYIQVGCICRTSTPCFIAVSIETIYSSS